MFKYFNRKNTPHINIRAKVQNYLLLTMTRSGFIQLTKHACEALGVKPGDGIVVAYDEEFNDYYLARGDANRDAFVLVQVGKSARVKFVCSGITDMLSKACGAPNGWVWASLNLFPAQNGMLGIDVKHPHFPKVSKKSDKK